MLVGVCLGFLPHNFSPARIFMGDSGSMLIGLMLAASAITASSTADSQTFDGSAADTLPLYLPFLLPLVVLAVPLVDLVLAVVRRVKAGRSPFAPDKQHLHHRLLEIGHSHRRAVLLMYFWSALLAFGGVAMSIIDDPLRVLSVVGGAGRDRDRAVQRAPAARVQAAVTGPGGPAAGRAPVPASAAPWDLSHLRAGLLTTAVLAVVGVPLTWLVRDARAAAWVLVGLAIVAVFFSVGAYAVAAAGRVSESLTLPVALGTYLLKIALLGVLLVSAAGQAVAGPEAVRTRDRGRHGGVDRRARPPGLDGSALLRRSGAGADRPLPILAGPGRVPDPGGCRLITYACHDRRTTALQWSGAMMAGPSSGRCSPVWSCGVGSDG